MLQFEFCDIFVQKIILLLMINIHFILKFMQWNDVIMSQKGFKKKLLVKYKKHFLDTNFPELEADWNLTGQIYHCAWENFHIFQRLFRLLGFFLLMSLDVFEKVIRSDEGTTACCTNKLLFSSVSSLVSGQFITSCKNLVTVRIGAVKRFLS